MRALVLHDQEGNISTVVTAPPDAPMPAYGSAQPGRLVSEVELPDGLRDPTDEDGLQRMLQILEEYRVDVAREAKLVPKRPAKE